MQAVAPLINKTPRILQISPYEISGGAAKVALDLHQTYRSRGYSSYLAVGRKDRNDDHVFLIPNQKYSSTWTHFWQQIKNRLIAAHHSRLAKIAARLSQVEVKQIVQAELGIENFDFPGTYDVLNLLNDPPDIVHAHNLHLNYFDLRALPWLSRQIPLIISLHDAWLLSGHCAHSIGCERWITGCGKCPDLRIYAPVKRDATAYNWRRKKRIYANSRLYIATASQWLMKKVEQSMLYPAVLETRVIPYGVDLSVFNPWSKSEARAALNIPQDKAVMLLRAKSLMKNNYWLDYQVTTAIIDAIMAQSQTPVIIIALGDKRPTEYFGQSEIRYIPFLPDHRALAQYYQAADIFFHPARADTFPLAVLEALACGTPVVATQVGGIPEQILDGMNGFLAPASDSKTMIERILRLLRDPELCSQMSQSAANDARKRFDHERHVSDYLDWYREILESRLPLRQTVHAE
jgi:glycosyltransferase involved in cell wall biosynthesis